MPVRYTFCIIFVDMYFLPSVSVTLEYGLLFKITIIFSHLFYGHIQWIFAYLSIMNGSPEIKKKILRGYKIKFISKIMNLHIYKDK